MSPHGPWLPITSERTIRACQVLRRLLPSPSLGTLTSPTRHPRTLTPPPSPSDPQNFATEPTDVFVCSYPKSGTTWMQAVLAQIVTNLERASTFAHVSEVSPFFEIDPHWDPDDERRLSPTVRANHARFARRCFNTHLPWSLMPRGGGAAYVYVVRDGRDAARSFHAHLSSQASEDGGYDEGWNAFFDEWIDGRIAFGSWFEHLRGWADAPASGERVLVVRYEDALADLARTVRRVATFVGVDEPSDEFVRAVAAKCTFDAMRADIDRYQPRSVRWIDPSFSFVRKGIVGDHAATFDDAQARRFDAKARASFGPRGIQDAPLLAREMRDGARDGECRV